ncbi:MAG: FecR domain-containing protein [Odoribacteraceae bacterium]|jgi:ferric-dicitrate binding protein FerR (iron transport regulator)|nr:FecR domain-containing protein [Odoribacteraceae bacterium]
MNNFTIARIIAREITGGALTGEEEQILVAWRASSPANEACYMECKSHRSREEYTRIVARFHVKEERERLLRRVRRGTLWRLYRRVAVAIPAAAAILLLVGYLARLPRDASPRASAIEANILPPGSSKAILLVEDGQLVMLGGNGDKLLSRGGPVRVKDTNNTLAYSLVEGDDAIESAAGYNALRTPAGGEYRLALADGTLVHLNAGTEIRYPVTFAGETREMELSGEAYFEVAGDARPFILHVPGATIRVLGTSFNAKAEAGQSLVVATLEKGSVEVTCGRESHLLTPGEQLIYDRESGSVETRVVETRFYTSWKDGYYYFEETPLEEILGMVSAWYGIRVTYAGEQVKRITFSGLLNRYSEMNALLDMFEETNEVSLSIQGKEIAISKKETGQGNPAARQREPL